MSDVVEPRSAPSGLKGSWSQLAFAKQLKFNHISLYKIVPQPKWSNIYKLDLSCLSLLSDLRSLQPKGQLKGQKDPKIYFEFMWNH